MQKTAPSEQTHAVRQNSQEYRKKPILKLVSNPMCRQNQKFKCKRFSFSNITKILKIFILKKKFFLTLQKKIGIVFITFILPIPIV